MRRRTFIQRLAGAAPLMAGASLAGAGPPPGDRIRLFLSGDVMTGRGVDQILPHRGDPQLYEPYVRNARRYVDLAEAANGPIEAPVDFAYPWGEALAVLERAAPDLRIINLETSITASDRYWRGKGIHYRMNPDNVGCLTAAGIDCAVLANNHVLDWGYAGLEDTLSTLQAAGISVAGAGRDRRQAEAPATFRLAGGARALVFGFGVESSGIPADWAAGAELAGIRRLADLSEDTLAAVAAQISRYRRAGDTVVASIHWGGNWGYAVPYRQRAFARGLIEQAGVDIVHGHSSHHPKAIEFHRGKPIFYGCGDLLNDYEGIGGHEAYRPELSCLYLVTLDERRPAAPDVAVVPMRIEKMRLIRAPRADAAWLQQQLHRESAEFGTRVRFAPDGALVAEAQGA